jgi:hypothetical protein
MNANAAFLRLSSAACCCSPTSVVGSYRVSRRRTDRRRGASDRAK